MAKRLHNPVMTEQPAAPGVPPLPAPPPPPKKHPREDYELALRRMEHEQRLENKRLSWFLTFQGLLFAAAAIAGTQENARLLDFYNKVLPLTGAAVSLCTMGSVMASQLSRWSIKRWYESKGVDETTYPSLSPSALGSRLGRLSAFVIPLIMGSIWIYVLDLQVPAGNTPMSLSSASPTPTATPMPSATPEARVAVAASPAATPPAVPAQTPDTITVAESTSVAKAEFPDLNMEGSPINQLFVQKYRALAASNPHAFDNPNWPLLLARECARELRQEQEAVGETPATTGSDTGTSGPATNDTGAVIPGANNGGAGRPQQDQGIMTSGSDTGITGTDSLLPQSDELMPGTGALRTGS